MVGQAELQAELRPLVGVPDELDLIDILCFGPPKEASYKRWKRSLEEILSWDRYDMAGFLTGDQIDEWVRTRRHRVIYRDESNVLGLPGPGAASDEAPLFCGTVQMRGLTVRHATWAGAAVGVLVIGLVAGLLAARLQAPQAVARSPLHATSAPPAQPTAAPTPDAWWKPLPQATAPFVPTALVIEKLKVQAPIEIKGIDAHNVMEAPDRPTDAAWYRFTARPGSGSNAVFAGHKDYGQVGNPAIFWHLDELVAGDLIDVVSSQQTEIRYRVTQSWDYSLSTIPMQKVLATDPSDEVTLITCSGTYGRGVGYDHRLVVRAVRVA